MWKANSQNRASFSKIMDFHNIIGMDFAFDKLKQDVSFCPILCIFRPKELIPISQKCGCSLKNWLQRKMWSFLQFNHSLKIKVITWRSRQRLRRACPICWRLSCKGRGGCRYKLCPSRPCIYSGEPLQLAP